MDADSETDWVENEVTHAVQVWAQADVLYESPVRGRKPECVTVSESIAERPAVFESHLVPLLLHPNALVAGYAVLTLWQMQSRHVTALPAELLERRDPVNVMRGHFAKTMELGSFALRLQDSVTDSIWHDVPAEKQRAWMAVFAASQEILSLAAPCPICGERALRRFFHVGRRPEPPERPSGGLWEWCAACHAYAHYSAGVPDWWQCDLEVDGDRLTVYPTEIERAMGGRGNSALPPGYF
jgi:hypothetical protein